MRTLLHRCTLTAAASLLAACAADPSTAPTLSPSDAPAALLAPGEGIRALTDSVDAAGNTIMVYEYAAGVTTAADGLSGSIGSVTIRTVIPATGNGSGSCITSTIVRTEVVPGWTASVKKAGGCDKEISVLFENRATGKKATFSFLYIFGKTRIDSGVVR